MVLAEPGPADARLHLGARHGRRPLPTRLRPLAMPTKEAHIQRWQVAASFVVMVIVFVVLLAWENSTANEAHRLSIANRDRITEISRLRSQRVRELHDQDVRA